MNPPFVLVPISITDAMLSSCTIAEPAASETGWVSAGTYVVGDLRIRTTTHMEYECVLGHTGITTLPENDPTRWLAKRPTLRWAAFDGLISTPSTATTSFTYVLRPGFFNSISMYGLDGATVDISIKDEVGGTVFFTYEGDLAEPPTDWYDWLFGPIRPLRKLVLRDILPYPDPELTITVTTATGDLVSTGIIAIGDMRPLLDAESDFGGVLRGAKVEPITYSYINTDFDGTTRITRRASATGMSISIVMPADQADYALATLQDVLDVPACWIASTTPDGWPAGLNVFGLASGSLSYDSFAHAVLQITVKGSV